MDKKLEARIAKLERLIGAPEVEAMDEDTYEKLASMLHSMDVTKMRKALSKGADPDMSTVKVNHGNGYTALRSAAIFGEYRAAKLLLDEGADVNMEDSAGFTPLDYAEENGSEEVINLLLKHGARNGSHKRHRTRRTRR